MFLTDVLWLLVSKQEIISKHQTKDNPYNISLKLLELSVDDTFIFGFLYWKKFLHCYTFTSWVILPAAVLSFSSSFFAFGQLSIWLLTGKYKSSSISKSDQTIVPAMQTMSRGVAVLMRQCLEGSSAAKTHSTVPMRQSYLVFAPK